MKYAQIRKMDISNGESLGVSLFVQGCHHHCRGCFNPETWDFDGGTEWTEDTRESFLKLTDKPYIRRVTILGGSPLAEENLDGVYDLVLNIRERLPDKKIWIYTGYTWDDMFSPEADSINKKRRDIISNIDVLIDGLYMDEKRDLTLKFCGSSNQRLIDVKKSLDRNEIVEFVTNN